MSIKSIASSTPMPYDLAKKIGLSGVNEILNVFWKGYNELKMDDAIHIDASSEEDGITQKWYEKICSIWESRNRATAITLNGLFPFHQYSDNTMKKHSGRKAPTIDFCFKEWNTNSYFGAEAKNLYKNKKDKIKRYISTGIENYTSGRYGSRSSESSMIGYVLTGRISDIVAELRIAISKTPHIDNLTRVTDTTNPQYRSKHLRSIDDHEIIIHHLFFDFSSLQ